MVCASRRLKTAALRSALPSTSFWRGTGCLNNSIPMNHRLATADASERSSMHLVSLLNSVRANPTGADGQFQFHSQPFEFGPTELDGLRMFLAEPAAPVASPAELTAGKIGNCVACHAAPNFTDFKLHNTGTTQKE